VATPSESTRSIVTVIPVSVGNPETELRGIVPVESSILPVVVVENRDLDFLNKSVTAAIVLVY